MFQIDRKGWMVLALAAAAVLGQPARSRADAKADFFRLLKEFERQVDAREYEAADTTAAGMRQLAEGPLKDEPRALITAVECQAGLCQKQSRYADATPLLQWLVTASEAQWGTGHENTATCMAKLAVCYLKQSRYADAEAWYQRALAIREKRLGPEHADLASSLSNIAYVYHEWGRYAEAETMYKRSMAISEEALGSEHPEVARSLNNLAELYREQGRYSEAEPLYLRSGAIWEEALGPEHRGRAAVLHNLALLYHAQGRDAEAEPLFQRSRRIWEKILDPADPELANCLMTHGELCISQGRYVEAESLCSRALAMREKALGPDHPDVARSLVSLAGLYEDQCRYAEAEPLYKRSLAIREKALGTDHPDVAQSVNNLGILHRDQGRDVEAEQCYKRSLEILERIRGAEHFQVATILNNLAFLRCSQGRYAEAEPLVDRAITIDERARVAPGTRFERYQLRAKISWNLGRKNEAVEDLKRAMDLAEQQRGQIAGAERERAATFTRFATAYERMVAWQTELGNPGEVLVAIERGRARSLLDEMNLSGADLHVGRPAAERQQLRQHDAELHCRVATLEKQLNLAAEDPAEQKERLQAELAEAREALYQHYRDERTSSPVYRNLLSVGAGPPRLSQIQRSLGGEGAMLLVYLVGNEGTYVLVVTPDAARSVAIQLDSNAAEALGVQAGPLTAPGLKTILLGDESEGVLAQLRDPAKEKSARPRLAALWQVLVPQVEREQLLGGKIKRLIVIPDGPLALLPLETLVVEPGESPKYLLDVGPPLAYSPSVTVLFNLTERRRLPGLAGRDPVLSVGNPRYAVEGTEEPAPPSDVFELAARGRYGSAGGRLTPLPASDWEASWVAEVFGQQQIGVTKLTGSEATESNVRQQASGRRVVHLACHGLADQSFGNFFGALALTPGSAPDNPLDDGFLTLPEIYELNLQGCELAFLSACETNYGPEQRGEGVWALSRGFLVAGSRRVVASNWLVDDEAAASLISYCCSGIAQAEKEGRQPDYAQTLHEAKRWVRKQEKWESPYYWGTFVLVGPN